MQPFFKRSRPRARIPRWPSRDHRDYLTAGASGASRPRTAPAVAPASPVDERAGGSRPLTRIVGVHRENVLLVELRASYVSFDRRPEGPGRGPAGEACAEATPDRVAVVDGDAPPWTLTLTLN